MTVTKYCCKPDSLTCTWNRVLIIWYPWWILTSDYVQNWRGCSDPWFRHLCCSFVNNSFVLYWYLTKNENTGRLEGDFKFSFIKKLKETTEAFFLHGSNCVTHAEFSWWAPSNFFPRFDVSRKLYQYTFGRFITENNTPIWGTPFTVKTLLLITIGRKII